jgi:hypothetical protein
VPRGDAVKSCPPTAFGVESNPNMAKKPPAKAAKKTKKTSATPTVAENIEHISTEKLLSYDKNARTHSAEQVEQLAKAITRWGFTNPVLIDESNTLIAGHGRVMAAKSLGMATVPAVRIFNLSDSERRALVLADNKLAMNSGWDWDILKDELAALSKEGFDMAITGFDEEEVSVLDHGGDQLFDSAFDEEHEYVKNAGKKKEIKCPHCKKKFTLK